MKKILLLILCMFIIQQVMISNSSSPYGINVHTANNKVLYKVKAAKIGWIRVDIAWNAIEIKKGKYDFSQIDRIVKYAKSNDLSILAIIGGTPGWANGGKGFSYPPNNVNDWTNFVVKVVRRYSGTIKYWEIWNEPNLKEFFAYDKDVFVKKIFLPAAKKVKNINSKLFIVGPALSNSTTQGSEWYFWMKYILTNCKDYIDIVSHHIYDNRGVLYIYEILEKGEGLIPSVLEIIAESGFSNKPFWITETGWNTAYYTEEKQAELYLDFLKKMRAKELPAKVFFYEIIDIPGQNSLPWGILRYNLTKKPAYDVYKDFIAGKFPEDDEDDEINNEKCYAEKVTLNSTSNKRYKRIEKLRNLRDNILNNFPNIKPLIKKYYSIEKELYNITMNNSIIYSKLTKLVSKIDSYIDTNGYFIKPFFDKITKKEILDIINLYKKHKLSKELKTLLDKTEEIINSYKYIKEMIHIIK